MTARRKTPWASAGLALLLTASLPAGEKVQFRGSTSIALPKPTRSLEDGRNSRVPDSTPDRSEYESSVSGTIPLATSAPQMDKKLKEFLDKKKNWIFVNPYEDNYDAKTAEFMEGEKSTGLYDHRLMKEEDKSVMEKYLDEKNPSREQEADPESRGRDAERNPNGEPARPNERSNERAERFESSVQNLNSQRQGDKGLTFSIDQRSPTAFGQGSLFEQKPERKLFNDRPMMERQERSLSKEDLRKERDTRDADITRMLQPRGASAGVAPRFDPVNSTVDTTRNEASPIGGRRTDSFLNTSRPQATVGGINASGNGPIFSGGTTPSAISSRPGFDFGARPGAAAGGSFGSGSFSPPVSAPKPTVNNKPFVLPLPQRKF
jgi:hypothetical protein